MSTTPDNESTGPDGTDSAHPPKPSGHGASKGLSPPEDLDLDRLWQHALHVDTLFYQRVQVLLLVQTIVVAAVTVAYSTKAAGPERAWVLVALAFLGLFLTTLTTLPLHRSSSELGILISTAKNLDKKYYAWYHDVRQSRGFVTQWPPSTYLRWAAWVLVAVWGVLFVYHFVDLIQISAQASPAVGSP